MFNKCQKLKKIIGIDKFNTSKVINMPALFSECNSIEKLNLNNFNTTNVNNMALMFNRCRELKEIVSIDKFNTSKVTNMYAMFNECNSIEYLNLTNFDTTNVKDLSLMFQECFELKYLDLSNFNVINAQNMKWMFNKCYKLKEIKGIQIFIENIYIDKTGIFEDCFELRNKPNEEGAHPKVIEKKQITIIITSTDQNIKNYSLTCYNTDNMETIREKIFLDYPEFKHKDFYFLANGNIINERVSLHENKIEDGTAILLSEKY